MMAWRKSLKGDRPYFGATEAKEHGRASRRQDDRDMIEEGRHDCHDEVIRLREAISRHRKWTTHIYDETTDINGPGMPWDRELWEEIE
jgi:hypothetical protein